jgi:hypothetical protein
MKTVIARPLGVLGAAERRRVERAAGSSHGASGPGVSEVGGAGSFPSVPPSPALTYAGRAAGLIRFLTDLCARVGRDYRTVDLTRVEW